MRSEGALEYDGRVWPLALALLTCLSVDVSNPLLPGVVRLDGESVYWLRAERLRVDHGVATAPEAAPLPTSDDAAIVPPSRPVGSSLAAETPWPARPRSLTRGARAGPPTDEDD